MTKVKEKIQRGERMCGTHIHLSDPAITELCGLLGYDFLWVDMEHTRLEVDQIYLHHLAAKASGTPMFVRVPVGDLTYTKRVLEIGVEGIIFPMIQDYKDAEEKLSWTLYPPYGKRGCGAKGAVRYGFDDETAFYRQPPQSDSLCRFVQIEQKSAAEEVEKILDIPYLDGCILGMYDLSGSTGKLGDVFSKENLEYADRVIRAAEKKGKIVGVSTAATDEETLRFYQDRNVRMIASGMDYLYVLNGVKATRETLRKIQKN